MKEPFGRPGAAPSWSAAAKEAVGTAVSDGSRVWFTAANGVITEIFHPTVDTANTKDIQFLVTDGSTFFDEEKKDTVHEVECLDRSALAFKLTNTAKSGRYRITKRVVTDPDADSVVMKVSFEPLIGRVEDYRLYVLFAPHIKNMGYHNSGRVVTYMGRDVLVAWREDVSCAVAADVPFSRTSCGYAGASDGWQDVSRNFGMDWSFTEALDGNIALTAEVALSGRREFTLAVSFGENENEAVATGLKSLGRGYEAVERKYIAGWRGYLAGMKDLSAASLDGGRLYRMSAMVLKAHMDKTHMGVTASLSIPWGESRGDGESGGYHLIWGRDMVNAAFAFMAMGDMEAPVKILKFLARTQRPDGSWPQNMWLDGRPYLHAVQLDEVAFPIILAWRLKKMGVLKEDFYLMARKAAAYLLNEGPVTEQDRWEENSGFSPFTLAVETTALVCAGQWAKEAGELDEARHIMETADYWSSRIEEWTFSQCDCISEEDDGHFLRIVSSPLDALPRGADPCHAEVFIKNLPPEAAHRQGQIIDAGFLELARLGLRATDDAGIAKSLKLVDKLLRRQMPFGPLFYRYNNDGYGEDQSGRPFSGAGIGRLWPLLSGERGVFEAMAGRTPDQYIMAMEGAANAGGLIPEQIWDIDDIPERGLRQGRGTGSATPLMWAHAEYIKLLRTKADNRGCDLIPEVLDRYSGHAGRLKLTVWKINKPVRFALSDDRLRIAVSEKATLVWTINNWKTKTETWLKPTGLGPYYLDFDPDAFAPQTRLEFTFLYEDRWEEKNYAIAIV